jgi:hypothetical protein
MPEDWRANVADAGAGPRAVIEPGHAEHIRRDLWIWDRAYAKGRRRLTLYSVG